MNTLVIHLYDESTEELKLVYEGCAALGNIERIDHYIPKKELAKKIDAADTIIMLGHGGPSGLMNVDYSTKNKEGRRDPYMVDSSLANNLRGKRIVTVWCYSKRFAMANGLNGFWSDMWVSEDSEASMVGIKGFDQKYIRKECAKLSYRLRMLLSEGAPIESYPERLKQMDEQNNALTNFNYGGCQYFTGNEKFSKADSDPFGGRRNSYFEMDGTDADMETLKKPSQQNQTLSLPAPSKSSGKSYDLYQLPTKDSGKSGGKNKGKGKK